MLQYVLYFLIGGALVAFAAYLGSRGNGVLAAFVASLPVLFLLNVFVMYRVGGMDTSLTYARSVLLFLPAFVFYVALTIWLLPRLGMPQALAPGLPIYLVPVAVVRMLRHKIPKTKTASRQPHTD